jgi:hypothetical protein
MFWDRALPRPRRSELRPISAVSLAQARDARSAMTYGGMTVATVFPIKDPAGSLGSA